MIFSPEFVSATTYQQTGQRRHGDSIHKMGKKTIARAITTPAKILATPCPTKSPDASG
jgi:hypothetical protein